MKIQVNSDKSIAVDASLVRFVQGEVSRVLSRFATRLTRVEVHLSDVDSRKTGHADKRCLIEVRPAGARPLSVSAETTKLASAVAEALGRMRRLLTTFFGRRGRTAAVAAPDSTSKNTVIYKKAAKATRGAKKRAPAEHAAVKKPKELTPQGPKKKWIYQARRKPWPAR